MHCNSSIAFRHGDGGVAVMQRSSKGEELVPVVFGYVVVVIVAGIFGFGLYIKAS